MLSWNTHTPLFYRFYHSAIRHLALETFRIGEPTAHLLSSLQPWRFLTTILNSTQHSVVRFHFLTDYNGTGVLVPCDGPR